MTVYVSDGKAADGTVDTAVDASITVRVTIIDADDPPEVSGRTSIEVREDVTGILATYTASDHDGETVTWEPLAGIDRAAFIFQDGSLSFATQPDYENPADREYSVTVRASETTSLSGESLTGSLDVTVTVVDAPGRVRLPTTAPQIGAPFTATLHDPDGVGVVTAWCWARSLYRDFPLADTYESDCDPTTTATYTPATADRDHYLRVTATYTDGDGTPNKTAMKVSDGLVSDQFQPPPLRQGGDSPGPGPSPGGGGGGDGGAPTCAEDRHGNSAAQATDMALVTETAGAICPAADIDYFTVTVPDQGVVFVDTTGGGNIRGTIWQDEVVLASGLTGQRQAGARLGTLVQAGPVVMAIQGQGGATGAYELAVTFASGYLENPGPESFQSGVGVLSGWVCEAAEVEIEIETERGTVLRQGAAYGTERLDTARACGDVDNGFGLLFNWNLLGDGDHTVVAYVDGVELGWGDGDGDDVGRRVSAGGRGEGACAVEDFPVPGESVTLVWQQNKQNFVIAGGSPPTGVTPRQPSSLTGFLENPGMNSFQSGVGVISGLGV